uniref:C-type lectin domain-containing protein n=1 Tax=Cyprinodon variegatus TaxID=28743 RepID=A0A3Q2FYD2_CYPVA
MSPLLPAICPPGWQSFKGSCYWIVSNINMLTTWHEAATTCSGMSSMKEQSWVETTSNVWTGLNDLAIPGLFMWSDEHIVTFTYWAPGEPNNHNGFSEDCVEIWNDKSCTQLNNYVCKMKSL